MSEMAGMESGGQENAGGMPVGPEPYNPAGQTMPTDGGPGSSPTPGPGAVASPGPDEYNIVPNVSGSSEEQVGHVLGGAGPSLGEFASMPTPDN
jgi:hypothetical protein